MRVTWVGGRAGWVWLGCGPRWPGSDPPLFSWNASFFPSDSDRPDADAA